MDDVVNDDDGSSRVVAPAGTSSGCSRGAARREGANCGSAPASSRAGPKPGRGSIISNGAGGAGSRNRQVLTIYSLSMCQAHRESWKCWEYWDSVWRRQTPPPPQRKDQNGHGLGAWRGRRTGWRAGPDRSSMSCSDTSSLWWPGVSRAADGDSDHGWWSRPRGGRRQPRSRVCSARRGGRR